MIKSFVLGAALALSPFQSQPQYELSDKVVFMTLTNPETRDQAHFACRAVIPTRSN